MSSRAAPDHFTDPIVAAFDRIVERDPGRLLVVAPGGASSRSDVDALARAAARAIEDARLPGRGPVGLVARNGASFLAGLIACLRSGHPAVLLDPGMTQAEIERVGAVLGFAAVLRARSDAPRDLRDFEIEPGQVTAAGPGIDGEIVKLTSGSTGEPRGVVNSSAQVLADGEMLRAAMRIGERDRIVAMLPFSHSYALGAVVIPALVAGVPLLIPSRESPFEPLRSALQWGGTILPTAPAWVAAMARLAEPPAWPATIATVVAAGAPLLPAPAAEFRERYGVPIHVLYGASEAGGICYDREGGAGERGTVGEPLEGVRVRLLPSEESSGAGQLAVESEAVATGYYPQADSSLERGRFVSQDLATLEGSELRLIGRLDRIINIRGRKVHPHEVERVIAQLDCIEDVVVDGWIEAPQGEPVVRAIVAAESGSIAPEQVIAWCRGRLSDYKVPRRVVVVPSIPRTERAKLDRAAIELLDHA